MSRLREHWLPDHPLEWGFGFAALYVLLHGVTLLLGPVFDIVSDQISLIYLPAFVRVISVVVAGAAGLAGIAAGALLINFFYHDMPLLQALSISAMSAIGVFTAYWVLSQAMLVRSLPIRLPTLIVLTGLYCTFNAMLHGLVWPLFGMAQGLTLTALALMMLGDLLGVTVMFVVFRVAVRWLKRSRMLGNHWPSSLT